jgi:hypothetical protein
MSVRKSPVSREYAVTKVHLEGHFQGRKVHSEGKCPGKKSPSRRKMSEYEKAQSVGISP